MGKKPADGDTASQKANGSCEFINDRSSHSHLAMLSLDASRKARSLRQLIADSHPVVEFPSRGLGRDRCPSRAPAQVSW